MFSFQLCKSDLVDYIEVKAPQCTKIHTYSDDTGIIEGQYTVAMKKDMTKTDLEVFVEMIQKQSSDPNNLMKIKNLLPAMELKMFIVDLDDAALQWVCYITKKKVLSLKIIFTDLSKSSSGLH